MIRRMIGVAGLLLAITSTPALGATLDVTYLGSGLGRNVKVTQNGNSRNVFSGQLFHDISGTLDDGTVMSGTYTTYCTELAQNTSGSTNPFEEVEVEDAPVPGPMGATKAQAIVDMYAFAGGLQLQNSGNGGTNDFASAFQLAIWEVVYDYDGTEASLDTTSGNIKYKATDGGPLYAGVQAHIDNLFDAVGLNAVIPDLFALVSGDYQDQLVVVPLPAPLLMGCAGLGLVWLRRRK